MPTSDLDMPLLPSSEQIRRREFATVRRGYDPQQVRMYLESIAAQVETLERELSELRLQADAAGARWQAAAEPATAPVASPVQVDPYEALSKRFASLIEVADQEAARTIDDARTEAAHTLDEARAEADRIRVDAQANAEEARQQGTDLLERAKIESDRALSGLADRRRSLMEQLREMRSTLLAAADELSEPLDAAANEVDDEIADDAGAEPAAAPTTPNADPIDPPHDDLWVSSESVELPDLTAIDLDFDERE
jgi:DivIVA domain-containing protein